MDPATILILLGAFYAIKSGFKGVKLARAAASKASVPASTRGSGKKAGGGMPAWFNNRRHTGTGWWAGEIGHGFPVFRAGMREGWTRHQTAMGQRQAAGSQDPRRPHRPAEHLQGRAGRAPQAAGRDRAEGSRAAGSRAAGGSGSYGSGSTARPASWQHPERQEWHRARWQLGPPRRDDPATPARMHRPRVYLP